MHEYKYNINAGICVKLTGLELKAKIGKKCPLLATQVANVLLHDVKVVPGRCNCNCKVTNSVVTR